MEIKASVGLVPDRAVRKQAAARLRHRISDLLYAAQRFSGASAPQLSDILELSADVVEEILDGNGNISINELGEFLAVMGLEVDLQPVRVGEILRAAAEHRAPEVAEITARDQLRSQPYMHVTRPWGARGPITRANSSLSQGTTNQTSSQDKEFNVGARQLNFVEVAGP